MGVLNLGRAVEKVLGLDKSGIGKLRSIEWGKTYLWDCQFLDPKPNPPFDTFFPASDIELVLSTVNSFDFEGYNNSFKIPSHTSSKDIKLTFYDDAKGTLLNYFEDWMENVILNKGIYTATLEDAVRLFQYNKLDSSKTAIDTRQYWVYPEGVLAETGDSNSGAKQYSVTLVVAMELPRPGDKETSDSELLATAKKYLKQFTGGLI